MVSLIDSQNGMRGTGILFLYKERQISLSSVSIQAIFPRSFSPPLFSEEIFMRAGGKGAPQVGKSLHFLPHYYALPGPYIARHLTRPRAHFSVRSPRGQSLLNNRQSMQGSPTVTVWELNIKNPEINPWASSWQICPQFK